MGTREEGRGGEVADERVDEGTPPRALRAPCVAPERQCWHASPRALSLELGCPSPNLSPSLLMAALGDPYNPAALCVDKHAPEEASSGGMAWGSQGNWRWRGEYLRRLAAQVTAGSEPLDKSGGLHKQKTEKMSMRDSVREKGSWRKNIHGMMLFLFKYIMHRYASPLNKESI